MEQRGKVLCFDTYDALPETLVNGKGDNIIQNIGLFRKKTPIQAVKMDRLFEVETLHGIVFGKPGDWLAKTSEGDLYPIEESVFEKMYTLEDGLGGELFAGITLSEVRKMKLDIEDKIATDMKDFESKTNLPITQIVVHTRNEQVIGSRLPRTFVENIELIVGVR